MKSATHVRRTSMSWFTAATCLWLAGALLPGRAEPQDRVTVLGEKTVWRYHAVLRPPVVGTARQPAEGQTVGDNWVLQNSDFSSRPPAGNWTAPNFDDSRWLTEEGPLFGGYGSERPVGLALLCVRGRFLLGDPDRVEDLKLELEYRGGAVVYLNGQQIARGDVPNGRRVDPTALANDYPREAFVTPDGEALLPNFGKARPPAELAERYDARIRSLTVDVPEKLLERGPNVLAVELHRTAIPPDLPVEGRGAWDTAGMVSLRLSAASDAGLATADELAGAQVWVAGPLMPVEATTRAPDALTDPGRIEIAAPVNGFAAGQVCVSSAEGVRGLEVVPSDLVSPAGKIAASQVQVRYARFSYKLPALVDRPVEGAPLLPVWLTFHVPEDAAPGTYTGSVELRGIDKPASVPVELTVPGWRVGSPSEWRQVINYLQSPESLAGQYRVPMWSDEHFRLIERSFELMAAAGNDVLGVQAVGRSFFGDDPVIVFRRDGGKYTPEFKFFDRYTQLYDRVVGKPLLFAVHVWTWGGRGTVETGREPVVIKELRGDELVTAELPPFGGPGTEELWRTTLDGVRERVRKLGWREEGVLLGTPGDSMPLPATVAFFDKVAPWAEWRVLTHGVGCRKWGLSRHKRTQRNGMVVGYLEIARWIPNGRPSTWDHPVTSNSRDHVGIQPYSQYAMPGFSALGGYDGFCWKGLDYWTFTTPEGERRNALNTYVSFGNVVGSTPRWIVAPEPEGPTATPSFEMMREGALACEAVRAIRENLDALYGRPTESCDVAEVFLDGALKKQPKSGRDVELEVTLIFHGDEILVRPYAPNWNTGRIGQGKAKAEFSDGGAHFELDIKLNDDRWVPGGEGSFTVDVTFDGEQLTGTYRGQFKGLAGSGSVRGTFVRGGYELPVGDPPQKTELARRCEEAIDTFFTSVHMDDRSMQARLQARQHAGRLYELAAETTAAVAAKPVGRTSGPSE